MEGFNTAKFDSPLRILVGNDSTMGAANGRER